MGFLITICSKVHPGTWLPQQAASSMKLECCSLPFRNNKDTTIPTSIWCFRNKRVLFPFPVISPFSYPSISDSLLCFQAFLLSSLPYGNWLAHGFYHLKTFASDLLPLGFCRCLLTVGIFLCVPCLSHLRNNLNTLASHSSNRKWPNQQRFCSRSLQKLLVFLMYTL